MTLAAFYTRWIRIQIYFENSILATNNYSTYEPLHKFFFLDRGPPPHYIPYTRSMEDKGKILQWEREREGRRSRESRREEEREGEEDRDREERGRWEVMGAEYKV